MSPTAVPTLAQLLADPGQVAALPPAEARALLLQLAPLQEALRLQALNLPTGENGRPEAPGEDRLLTPEETAERLGVTPRWLYRHARQLPFTRRLSRKALRFSEAGLRRYQAAKKA